MSHICRISGQTFSSFPALCAHRSCAHAGISHQIWENAIFNKNSSQKLKVDDDKNENKNNLQLSSVDDIFFDDDQVTDNNDEIFHQSLPESVTEEVFDF